jgi:uncharacterized membrane protein
MAACRNVSPLWKEYRHYTGAERVPMNENQSQTHFGVAVEILAPPQLVWAVMADVEHWPEWTPTISRLKFLTPGPFQVGSRLRIHQPKLPPAVWRVTELNRGAGFAWVSVGPAVRVTARHTVDASAIGTEVALSIQYEGLLGRLLAGWMRDLNERYLAIEAGGLKARCTHLAASHTRQYHEAH